MGCRQKRWNPGGSLKGRLVLLNHLGCPANQVQAQRSLSAIVLERPIHNVPERPFDNVPERPVDNVPERPIHNVPERPFDNVPDRPLDNVPERPVDNVPVVFYPFLWSIMSCHHLCSTKCSPWDFASQNNYNIKELNMSVMQYQLTTRRRSLQDV